MTKETDFKICASLACRFEGKPQPLMHFDVNATSKQPFRLCRECRAKDSKPDTINHENKIASMCEKAGITVEQLRGKTTHHVSAVRKTIAIELSALGVSIKKIAEMTGAPLSTAKRYLKPEEKPQDPQDKIKVAMASFAHKEIIGHISDSDDQADLPPGTISVEEFKKRFAAPDGENKYKIEIDFSKHREVFDELIDLADERLRDPDKMIIFILFKIFQEGVKINETISTD